MVRNHNAVRVIDQPTQQTVVLGSSAGGLYAMPTVGWNAYFFDEYQEASEAGLTQTRDREVCLQRIPELPFPTKAIDPSSLVVWPAIEKRFICLDAYEVNGAIGYYGFDRETKMFFVRHRQS